MPDPTIYLPGFNQQIHARNVDDLERAYCTNMKNTQYLDGIARRVVGYQKLTTPVTSDGHQWLCGIHYWAPSGNMEILFPMTILDEHDELSLERRIVIFGTRNVLVNEVEDIVAQLTAHLSHPPKEPRQSGEHAKSYQESGSPKTGHS